MKRLLYILIVITGCKEAYHPPVKIINSGYLVVEGNIIAGNDSTFIRLSGTVAVSDTAINHPEPNANVIVESEDGENYQLQNENNGVYYSPPLNININKKYRLHIFTADGKEYASDFVPVEITPAIDSVSWKFDSTGGINIYVNTHDVTNNTQYYRWEFTETWEHRSIDSSQLIYNNGALRPRTHDEQIYRCWNIITSGDIFISSTAALSSDVVFEKKLIHISYKSLKVRYYYSVLVKQYALTREAFEFWQNLKKNTEQIGSIFDPQPFADFGNIHCLSNPEEIVLGFISACSAVKQRLYIAYAQVHYPYDYPPFPDCTEISVPLSKIDEVFSLGIYLPLNYDTPVSVAAYQSYCLDCREQGGTTIKPPYMP